MGYAHRQSGRLSVKGRNALSRFYVSCFLTMSFHLRLPPRYAASIHNGRAIRRIETTSCAEYSKTLNRNISTAHANHVTKPSSSRRRMNRSRPPSIARERIRLSISASRLNMGERYLRKVTCVQSVCFVRHAGGRNAHLL